MLFPVTALYALPLTLLCLVLWVRVSSARARLKVSIGDAGNTALHEAIRRHGNFIEWVALALPLMLIAGQMALGFEQLQLPKMIGRREVQRESLRRVVHKMRPISRRIERIIRPRMPWVFYPRNERLIGLWLLLVAFALFLPLPLSGWFPAISLLVSGFGLIERDGLVLAIGAIMGAASILITLLVATTLAIGAEAVI